MNKYIYKYIRFIVNEFYYEYIRIIFLFFIFVLFCIYFEMVIVESKIFFFM